MQEILIKNGLEIIQSSYNRKNPEELGEFVEESTMITGTEEEFKKKIGVSSEEWKTICKSATESEIEGMKFKEILQKNLSEVI